MRFFQALLLVGVSLGTPLAASAAEPASAHTFKLAEGESAPNASIDQVSWLVGNWTGQAFGKPFEEVWNPPSAGTMVGMFKLLGDDDVEFYEILLLTEIDGTLSLRVKHFTRDFIAWEEKEDFVDFRLVKIEPDAVHFKGLSFYRKDENAIDGFILMRNGDTVTEHSLTYQRRSADSPD